MSATQIFTNQTTNGQSSEFTINGKGTVQVSGTFDGATINVQAKLSDNSSSSFSNVQINGTYTAPVIFNLEPPKGIVFRLDLSGAGASTDINAFVEDNR